MSLVTQQKTKSTLASLRTSKQLQIDPLMQYSSNRKPGSGNSLDMFRPYFYFRLGHYRPHDTVYGLQRLILSREGPLTCFWGATKWHNTTSGCLRPEVKTGSSYSIVDARSLQLIRPRFPYLGADCGNWSPTEKGPSDRLVGRVSGFMIWWALVGGRQVQGPGRIECCDVCMNVRLC